MGAVIRLISAEFMKAIRLKLPWLGLALSAITAVFARQSVEQWGAPGELNSRIYLITSINLVSTAIIPIFSSVFAASLIASETSRGTLRMLLPRPILRSQLLHAKLFTGLFYLMLMFLANLAVALPISSIYPARSAIESNIEIPALPAQVGIFAIGLFFTIIPHAATVCFALLISVLSRSVATAIGVAVGVVFFLFTIQVYARFGTVDLGDYIFTSYYDAAMGITDSIAGGFSERWNQEKIHMLLITSTVSSALFLGLAYLIFTRRDLNG